MGCHNGNEEEGVAGGNGGERRVVVVHSRGRKGEKKKESARKGRKGTGPAKREDLVVVLVREGGRGGLWHG